MKTLNKLSAQKLIAIDSQFEQAFTDNQPQFKENCDKDAIQDLKNKVINNLKVLS